MSEADESSEIEWVDGLWTIAVHTNEPIDDDLEFECPVIARLSGDRVHLQLALAPDALLIPKEMLSSLIQEQTALHGVTINEEDARDFAPRCREGEWVTVLSGTPPRPPDDGRVEILVFVPTTADVVAAQAQRTAVRAGTAVAQLRDGRPGELGVDLFGEPVPVRAPRDGQLHRGENTVIDDTGRRLLATCDGEVVLRNLRLHIVPVTIVDAWSIDGSKPFEHSGDLFIQGTVTGGRVIRVGGDVHVSGNVQRARIESDKGSVSVGGGVTGDRERPCVLSAAKEVVCDRVIHSKLRAGDDIHLTEARYCQIQAGRNVYLRRGIEESLFDVDTRVGGGIIPPTLPPEPEEKPTQRQHYRVLTDVDGEVAQFGEKNLQFASCKIEDLSLRGAKCRLTVTPPTPLQPGTPVHLKFSLDNGETQIALVGRVVRLANRNTAGVAFVDLSSRDYARLAEYCHEQEREHPTVLASSPDQRRNEP